MNKALREGMMVAAVFAVLLGGLYLYAGTWPPAVIVESGSMMRADHEVAYGRLGTIDPGDLVVVKRVDGIEDITTQAEGGRDRYGAPGDVIVYYRANDRASTPIIHRAVAYVEVQRSAGATVYDVRWGDDAPCEGGATKVTRAGRSWCRFGEDGVLIPSAQVWDQTGSGAPRPYRPPSTGFLTKGDNPVTNTQLDQVARISLDADGDPVPVPVAWVEGEGRGELPWLGLLKLAIAKEPNEDRPPAAWTRIGNAWAPTELWVMLVVSLAVVMGGPFAFDALRARMARRRTR